MEQYYTVSSEPKRLPGADNYGNVTDSVFFEGEQTAALFKHSEKTVVQKGSTFYGKIEDLTSAAGKPWRKFTRVQEPDDNRVAESSPSAGASSYNGDGARQGMAINNAAKYVVDMAVKNNRDLDPVELADEIAHYAKEIYKIDLTVTVNKSKEDEILELMNS